MGLMQYVNLWGLDWSTNYLILILCFNFNIRKGEANTKQTIALLPTAIDQKLKSVIAREKDISWKMSHKQISYHPYLYNM